MAAGDGGLRRVIEEVPQLTGYTRWPRRGRRAVGRALGQLPWLAALGLVHRVGRLDLHHLRLFGQRVVNDLVAVEALPVAGTTGHRAGAAVNARQDVGAHRVAAVTVDDRLGRGWRWGSGVARGDPGGRPAAHGNHGRRHT